MRRILGVVVAMWMASAVGISQQDGIQEPELTVAAGVKLQLAMTRAVWSARVKAGDTLYAETVFPVSVGQRMAIPAGSYVEGQVEGVVLPTRRKDRAELDVRLTKVILANGYVAEVHGTAAHVTVQVSRSSDILLDNGTQMEMSLGAPLALDGEAVRAAVAVARAPKPGEFAHATLCRPSAGTPGSTGVTIPGTPASPPTVIPGAPGMPDTVIPGSPGTPSQVVGAVPGTPGTVCPLPPLVVGVQGLGTRD
jgi:hypothetical protein